MKRLAYILTLFLILTGCKKEDQSGETEIVNFTLTSTDIEGFVLGDLILDREKNSISIFSEDFIDESSIPANVTPEISVSDGATISPASGETVTFSDKDNAIVYTVTAENGDQKSWYVYLRDNQLPNSDFEDWHQVNGLNQQAFLQPGLSEETTLWTTANMGTSTYGVYGTTPVIDGDNTLVKIETGETTLVPLTSGTIFTGSFDIQGAINNPTDPEQATDFGIPFIYRPSAIKMDYSFTAGSNYIEATLNDPNNIFGGFTVESIPGNDECVIYGILEFRDGESVTEIARAEAESGNTAAQSLTELVIPFVYESGETPTHITIVFASSKDGDLFTGAVGSTLIVDNLELLYE